MKESLKCSILMAIFFAQNCLVVSYAVLFLEREGYADSGVGLLIAGAAAVGGVLQFFSGRLADRYPKWYWKRQLVLLAGFLVLIAFLRLIPFYDRWWIGLNYGLLIVSVLLMMPLVNSTAFYYSRRGARVNFGIIRGIGSLSFAVVSFGIGFLARRHGNGILVWVAIVLAVLLLAAVLLMPGREKYPEPEREENPVSGKTGIGRLLKTYPRFFLMTAGITLIFVFHTIVSSYLLRIIEGVGGSTGNLGIALAIAAVSELPVLFLYSRIAKLPGASAKRLILIACAFFALRGVMFILAKSIFVIYVIQFLQCVSYALLTAAKATYAEESMKQSDKTTGQAAMSMTESFGVVAGTLLGGFLITDTSVHNTLIVATVIAFAGLGVTVLAAAEKKTKAE